MSFQKGDIVWVNTKERDLERLKHPAVVWDDEFNGYEDFLGVMLSRKGPEDGYNDNILMSDECFEKGYEVSFNNTHFVNQLFYKFQNWGPFHLAGRLTKAGRSFIEENLENTDPVEFINYRNNK